MRRAKAASFVIPSDDRARLKRGLLDLPAIMVKWYLQEKGLPQYLGASKESITDRFLGHIEREEMSLDSAYDAVREFAEFGAKEIWLFNADHKALSRIPAALKGHRVEHLHDARIRRQPGAPTANYAYLDASRLRLSFSEKHEDVGISQDGLSVIRRPETRVIVFEGDRATGQSYIAFDPPLRFHPHGAALDYYRHHLDSINRYLGTSLVPVDLRECIAKLETSELICVSRTEGKSQQLRVRLVADTVSDLRGNDLYRKFATDRQTADSATLSWLSEKSIDKEGRLRIARQVKTKVEAKTASVRFVQSTLEPEARYVIEQVRSNA
jgi:hypothetical protein